MKLIKRLWIGLGILILLTPIGILLPEHFKAGAAWGEWSKEEIAKLAGYVPKGFEKLADLWNAPLPDYSFKGWEEKGLLYTSLAYVVSAILGAGIIYLVVLLYGKIILKKGKKN